MSRSIFLPALMAVMLASLAYATSAVKMAPVTEDRSAEPSQVTPAEFCDPLWACDVEGPTGDFQILGCEYKWGYYWVTGGNSGMDPNKLYKFDEDCVLIATYDQFATTGGGLRDMAEDEDYIWGSFSSTLDAYDEFGNYVTSNPGPDSRALARDPDTGVWWTGNFSGPIYSFTSPPLVVLTTTPCSYPKYGMAYDICSPDGPWLWVFTQDNYNLRQFDPVALVYTGVVCMVNSGMPSTVAGGCCFDEATGDIYGIIQGTPDHLFAVDITEGCLGDTAYCEVLDVWTDAEYYLPGDEICLTVKWKFAFVGAGSPGWSDPEDFRVAGGVAKEPNLNPRQVDATVLYDVSPGTYATDFTFTVPMAAPLGTWVAGGGGVVPTWSGFAQSEASKLIEHNICIIDIHPPPEYLVWELDSTPLSGQPIGDALTALGRTWEFVEGPLGGYNLFDHQGLFILMGVYPNSGFIPAFSPEALQIEDYVTGGGNV